VLFYPLFPGARAAHSFAASSGKGNLQRGGDTVQDESCDNPYTERACSCGNLQDLFPSSANSLMCHCESGGAAALATNAGAPQHNKFVMPKGAIQARFAQILAGLD
jgi:hypothetical protein